MSIQRSEFYERIYFFERTYNPSGYGMNNTVNKFNG